MDALCRRRSKWILSACRGRFCYRPGALFGEPQQASREDADDLGELVVERVLMTSAHDCSPMAGAAESEALGWEPDEPKQKGPRKQASSDAHHEVRFLRLSRSLTMRPYDGLC
jgi:hypothetical protein